MFKRLKRVEVAKKRRFLRGHPIHDFAAKLDLPASAQRIDQGFESRKAFASRERLKTSFHEVFLACVENDRGAIPD
jgi:hypothetical protein